MTVRPAPMRPFAFPAAALLLHGLLATAASAQSVPAGAPPSGLQLSLQAGLPFSQFQATPAADEETYGRLRATNVQVRASHYLLSAASAWVEVGSSGRGSQFAASGAPDVDLRVTWWELGSGLNVALRCLGPVCPSVDAGAVLARRRAAIVREIGSSRPLGTFPIRRYEGSAVVGVRLAVQRLGGLALLIRHQEGLTNLRPDLAGLTVRSRAQSIGVGIPLTRN